MSIILNNISFNIYLFVLSKVLKRKLYQQLIKITLEKNIKSQYEIV